MHGEKIQNNRMYVNQCTNVTGLLKNRSSLWVQGPQHPHSTAMQVKILVYGNKYNVFLFHLLGHKS